MRRSPTAQVGVGWVSRLLDSTCTATNERRELEGGNDEVRKKRAVITRKLGNYSFTLMYELTIVLVSGRQRGGTGGGGDERGRRGRGGWLFRANKYH